MKICDLCQRVTPRFEQGPVEIEAPLEICAACLQDLLRRLEAMDRRIAELRQQQRAEAVAAWRQERSQKPDGPAAP
ncbi:hypothetical protein HQ590_14095 [bacterium]|nr:hypothetical protein [bacterium]